VQRIQGCHKRNIAVYEKCPLIFKQHCFECVNFYRNTALYMILYRQTRRGY
jgi:hypothetical protein